MNMPATSWSPRCIDGTIWSNTVYWCPSGGTGVMPTSFMNPFSIATAKIAWSAQQG